MGARYYGSTMGRFMSPDPLGGHIEDPQTLNRYAYARNNPLIYTDTTGLDFNLDCAKNNGTTCQGGKTYYKDASGDYQKTVVKSDRGNLTDQSGNTYSGTFDGKSVTFTNAQGQQSTGDWIQGSSRTEGIVGGGDLGPRFQFTFLDHGSDQTLNFDWNFNGTQALAAAILQKAGYEYFKFGTDRGYDEYRLPAQGRNSTHFLMEQSPKFTLPSANGKGHSGEYYPGVKHTFCDWMGLC